MNPFEHPDKDGWPLQRLLHTTEQMLGHAERLEWDQVDQLQIQRSADLQAGLTTPANTDTETVRETLANLLSLNDRLVNRVMRARSEVLENSRKLKQSRSAAGNYQTQQANQPGFSRY